VSEEIDPTDGREALHWGMRHQALHAVREESDYSETSETAISDERHFQ
jgi:hypothetical protein